MNKSLLSIIFLFSLSVFSTFTQAELREVTTTQGIIKLGNSIDYFIDENNKKKKKDVLSGFAYEEFIPHEKPILTVGYTQAPIWIKTKIVNRTSQTNDWIFGVNYAPLDKVTLYVPQADGRYREIKQGDHRPFANRDVASSTFSFALTLEKNKPTTLYLKVENASSIRIPITLATKTSYLNHQQDLKLIYGLLFGLMMALVLFNAFLYASTTDRGYLYYVLYALLFIWYQSARFGLLTQYAWGDNPWLSDRSFPFTLFGVILFSSLLTQHFLHTEEHTPTLHKLLNVTKYYGLAGIPLSLVIPNYFIIIQISAISVTVFFLFILTVSVANLKSGNRLARFYFPAWLVLICGVVIDAASSFGLLQSNLLTNHISLFAGALEALLLSIALGDRINIIQSEKDSAQKEARQALEKSFENLQRSSQIKDEFLSTVSHELKTPVNGVIGNLELLKTTKLNSSQNDYLVNATDSAAKLALMVDEILGFSELETGHIKLKHEPFELQEFIDGLQRKFLDQCRRKNLDFSCKLDSLVPKFLVGDKEKLTQLLSLVLDNAVKFTDKGHVELKIDRIEECSEYKNTIKFSVSDTGSGIPDDLQQKIFDSFYQKEASYNRSHGGLGIGLATCKQLAKLFGGDIQVFSHEGEGSRFEITVKMARLTQKEILARPEKEKHLPVVRDNKIDSESVDILIVEDNRVNQQLLANMCKKLGYKTHVANDGQEAIHSFLVEKVDIILMDCQMPIMDGLEATKQIRHMERGSEVPIIAVTANASEQDRRRCLAVGMNDFVEKPVHLDTIKVALERALSTPAADYHHPDNYSKWVLSS